jgi:hypothetical protein
MALCEKKEPAPVAECAVLIASGATDRPAGDAVPRCWPASQPRPKGDLRGPREDVEHVDAYLQEKGVVVHRKFCEEKGDPRKEDVLGAITEALRRSSSTTILYYSGHGCRSTGDWCFEKMEHGGTIMTYISFAEIVALWKKQQGIFFRSRLLLILDSCHSGAWVEKCVDLGDPFVQVQAACKKEELAWDGINGAPFTNGWLSFMRQELWNMQMVDTSRQFATRFFRRSRNDGIPFVDGALLIAFGLFSKLLESLPSPDAFPEPRGQTCIACGLYLLSGDPPSPAPIALVNWIPWETSWHPQCSRAGPQTKSLVFADFRRDPFSVLPLPSTFL